MHVAHVGLVRKVKLAMECRATLVEQVVTRPCTRAVAVDDDDVIVRVHLNGRLEAGHVDLDPYDLISIPPTVIRALVNISDAYANLLVLIQGQPGEFDDVERHPDTAAMLQERFGIDMLHKLQGLGYSFRAGLDGEA